MRRVISTHTPPRSPAPPHVSARRPAPIPSLFIRPHPAGRPPPLFPPPPYAGGRNGVPASHEPPPPPPGLSPHASPQAVTAARALRRLPPPSPPNPRRKVSSHLHGALRAQVGPQHVLEPAGRADVHRQRGLSTGYLRLGVESLHRHGRLSAPRWA